MNATVTNIDKLREVALDQHGFVTYQQAIREGVTQPALSMLLDRNRIERVAYGVYRVPQVPATQYDQFMLAVLWTGVPEACLSHETALLLRELCDVNPRKIHITVNKGRRFKREGGEAYQLHYQNLLSNQKAWFVQMPIVDIPTAIEQCIESGLPSYLVEQAISRAGKTSELPGSVRARLEHILEERNVRVCNQQ